MPQRGIEREPPLARPGQAPCEARRGQRRGPSGHALLRAGKGGYEAPGQPARSKPRPDRKRAGAGQLPPEDSQILSTWKGSSLGGQLRPEDSQILSTWKESRLAGLLPPPVGGRGPHPSRGRGLRLVVGHHPTSTSCRAEYPSRPDPHRGRRFRGVGRLAPNEGPRGHCVFSGPR